MTVTRVLSVVAALPFGGDESRLVSMLSSIDARAFRCAVAILPQAEGYDARSGTVRPALDAAAVPVFDVRQPTVPRWVPRPIAGIIRLIGRIVSLARLIRTEGIDVVDARLDGGMLVGIPAALATRRPSVSTLYWANKAGSGVPLWRLFRWATLNGTTAVVTDSAVRQRELLRWRWPRTRHVWHIPNGIAAPAAVRPPADIRAEFRIPANARVIAQISAIVPYKGQMVLVEAARSVVDRFPDAIFLLVGYCRDAQPFQDRLLARIHELGLSENVRVQPYAGPIGDIWQVVDVHVHATLFDSLPNAILEGMSLGKPAVVTRVGGIPEAVEDGQTGLVVPPDDAGALATAICRLLEDPTLAAALGDAARTRYDVRYRPEVMATRDRSVLHVRATIALAPESQT